MNDSEKLRDSFISKWRPPPGAGGLDVMAEDLDRLMAAVRVEAILDATPRITVSVQSALREVADSLRNRRPTPA